MGYLDRLAQLRKQKGWSQGDLAERVGVEQPTVQRWESGAREPKFEQLFKMAELFGVEPGSLLDADMASPVGPRLFVKGEVAAGVWRSAAEAPPDEWHTFTGRPDVTADIEHRFGLRVIGDSMNEIYPHGSIIECVTLFGRAEAVPGKRVVVLRTNEHGDVEATVKELVEQDGELWCVPRSHNPAHQPFKLNDPGPGIEEVRIVAVVVASIRPE